MTEPKERKGDSDANAEGKDLVDSATGQDRDVDAADLIESKEVKEALERIKKDSE
ncbi:MAG: hypothetical protein P1V20_04380 [Verrucomicrobiales bacterium]|nr:hypothetical protein [Verrucomicrobiales bacterium]